MERVLIIGSNGAGKSTFSADLARRTGIRPCRSQN